MLAVKPEMMLDLPDLEFCLKLSSFFPQGFAAVPTLPPTNAVGPVCSELGQFMSLHPFCAEVCDFRWF